MLQSSEQVTEICPAYTLSSMPTEGRWAWDEKKNELVYESRHVGNAKKGSPANEGLKIDVRTGFPIYRRQHRSFERIGQTRENNKITLPDIIQASLNVMSETFYVPIEFEEYLRVPQVQDFLLHLLNYFHWFFELTSNASPAPGKHIDRSQKEKDRIRHTYAHLLSALRELGCKYATLLLGVNLKEFHHMRNGDLFYSCTDIDRTIYESLLIVCTYLTWITFYRQHFDPIRTELARLFRASGDIEVLRTSTTEIVKEGVKDELSIGSMNRHQQIDCHEWLSRSLVKAATTSRTDEPTRETHSLSPNSFRQQQRADRLPLAKDSSEPEEDEQLHALQVDGRSPPSHGKQKLIIGERSNRLRDILAKRLETGEKTNKHFNNQVAEDNLRERQTLRYERSIRQQLLSSSSYQRSFSLPPPPNPLDDSHRMNGKQSAWPHVQFELIENIGILGKPRTNFDLLRLRPKPSVQETITMPEEYLVVAPDETRVIRTH